MKKILMAAVAVVSISCQASAQVVTISPAEITQLVKQIAELQRHYRAIMGVVGSLNSGIDVNSLSRATTGLSMLPGASTLSSMIPGGMSQYTGPINDISRNFRDANTVYNAASLGSWDYAANSLGRMSESYSNVQAMAQQSAAGVDMHLRGIEEIQSQLSTVSSSADIQAIQARLAAEQAALAGEQVRAQNVAMMAQAQDNQFRLMTDQKRRESADDLYNYAQGGGSQRGYTQSRMIISDVPTFSAR